MLKQEMLYEVQLWGCVSALLGLPNGIETHPQKIVCEWVSFGVNTIWAASSAL